MRWKQFFTPVQSIDATKAKNVMAEDSTIEILDVRQPAEYQEGHIASAKLIPLGDLPDHIDELNPQTPLIVYCAIGGRSRVAAQMLSGKGFKSVYNLTGGFKAWNGWTGFGDFEQGLEYFNDKASVTEVLASAYGMERALGEFYTQMAQLVQSTEAASLFHKLASIEAKHSTTVAEHFAQLSNGAHPPEPVPETSPEGGMTTKEYMERLGTDTESPKDIVEFAMALEAQAMDMYSRAAQQAVSGEAQKALEHIALEERRHLKHLATLRDQM